MFLEYLQYDPGRLRFFSVLFISVQEERYLDFVMDLQNYEEK